MTDSRPVSMIPVLIAPYYIQQFRKLPLSLEASLVADYALSFVVDYLLLVYLVFPPPSVNILVLGTDGRAE